MGPMEDVCTYALARLLRSRAVSVGARAPGRMLLQRRVREAIARAPRSAPTALDDILERVAQDARQRLAGLMPDPPASDPVGQLLLLRAAVAARPDLWEGLELAPAGADALAAALGLPAGSIPPIYLQRLAAQHEAFARLA
ncbi:hypothetical protein H8N03_06725 [Ramlibacter sp. USB13]|uniref:Uncharacterized protein n=1 Tax=Ramlibacter cellulosilyticus TaxID=2764187 RepID=A0A923MP15_9BURK|nr:hypothetical protein [Ramlibacter cellulosilyticus]MBC5782633.1 hypothetical protein [Ramlibacter cellulosilyticus]